MIHLASMWLAAVLMVTALVMQSRLVLAVILVVILGVMTWGWPVLVGMPNRGVGRLGMAAINCGALACAFFGSITHVAYVAALGVPMVYIGEMLRRDERVRMLTQVAGTYVGGLLGVGAALWLLLVEHPSGHELALAMILGMACAAPAGVFLRGPLVVLAVPILAALGAGGFLLVATSLAWWPALVFAAILGILAWGLEQMTPAMLTLPGLAPRVSFALIPYSAMGVVGYVLGLLVF